MPIPLWIGRLNKVGLNQVTKRLAGHLPGFGVVIHRGRRSGRSYRTPVNLFPVEGGFVVALTYGRDADWVKNVVAAGGCRVESRGRLVECTDPHVYHDEERQQIRPLERRALGWLDVSDFLSLRGQ